MDIRFPTGAVPLDTFELPPDPPSGNGSKPPVAQTAGVATPTTTPRRSAPARRSTDPPSPSAQTETSATAAAQTPKPRKAALSAVQLRPNRLEWRGRIASTPEMRRSAGGIDFCSIRIVQEVLNNQRQPMTQAMEVIIFRERAREFVDTFRQGDLIEVYGELRIREWQGKVEFHLHPSEEPALINRP